MYTNKPKFWQIVARAFENELFENRITWISAANTFNSIAALFDAKSIPRIGLCQFIDQIKFRTGCSDACFVVGYIYVQRALRNNLQLILTQENLYRFILSAVLLAQKFM